MALTFEDPKDQAAYRSVHQELQGTLATVLRGNLAVYSDVMGLFDRLEGMAFAAGAKAAGGEVAPAAQFSTRDVPNVPDAFPDIPTRPERPTVMPVSALATQDVTEMPEVVVRLREVIGTLQSQGWRPESWEALIIAVASASLIQAHVIDEQLLDTPMGRSVIRSMGLEEYVLRLEPPPVFVCGDLDDDEVEAAP